MTSRSEKILGLAGLLGEESCFPGVNKSRIAWSAIGVVGMVIALCLSVVAGKLMRDGVGTSFYIEPSTEAAEAAHVGEGQTQDAYVLATLVLAITEKSPQVQPD